MGDRVADDRVALVVDNWFPRFLANGLDYLDVRRTLDAVRSWDDWADAWAATAGRYEALAAQAEAAGHDLTAAEHRRRAALTLQFAQFVLNDDPTRRAALHRRQCELYARAAGRLQPPARRVEMPTGVGSVPGYLREPLSGTAAGVVLLVPGLESTKEQFSTLEPYLLDRGLATLSLEGPGQGETRYRRAFRDEDYAIALRGVSAFVQERAPAAHAVAVLGTSFGGYLALRHAAEVANLVAAVDIAGPFDLRWLDDMQPVVQEGFMHLLGVGDRDHARAVLDRMSLEGVLPGLRVPVLVLHGGRDPVIPVEHGRRIAAGLGPRATLRIEPEGNHSCNNLHTIVRPFVADWLRGSIQEAARA
ncbi:MAG TPA: alpha/beta fold hydrolase [Actinomycetes bacterium]|jgi:2,6-dihydroxypseudooxynicotine hydrolase|nr:alpha/beta fold hydrolase [Actinomycetes bacterium]